MKKITTIHDLLTTLGHAARIALDLNLHQQTVERWRYNGIPRKYCLYFAENTSLSIDKIRGLKKDERRK